MMMMTMIGMMTIIVIMTINCFMSNIRNKVVFYQYMFLVENKTFKGIFVLFPLSLVTTTTDQLLLTSDVAPFDDNLHQLSHTQPEPQSQGAPQVSEERDPAEAREVRVVQSDDLVQCEVERADVLTSADLGQFRADDCGGPTWPLTARLSRPLKQILQLRPGITAEAGSRAADFREISRGGPEW